jgi:hypothetical protein
MILLQINIMILKQNILDILNVLIDLIKLYILFLNIIYKIIILQYI